MKVSPWDKSVKITRERFGANCGEAAGKFCEPPTTAFKLEPLSEKTLVYSDFIHLPYTYGDKKLAEYLAPASTYFENSLGGRVVVFGSLPQGPNHLTESRKAQYVLLFNKLAPFSVWYDGDAEVYLKNFTLDDGSEFVAFTTVGIDPISPLTFGSTKSFTKAEMLGGDGKWRKVEFAQDADKKISVPVRAEVFAPVILRFYK